LNVPRRCGEMFTSLAAVAFALLLSISGACHGLSLADDAVVLRPFAPVGKYAGHWGIDLESESGDGVSAIGPGVVSFAGSVAGTRSVTIDHGGGIRTSYSYLDNVSVSAGQAVIRGTPVGSSGGHDERGAFHLSLRSDSTYLDPMILERCSAVPEPALWLADVVGG
jgi:hypothetical protein